MVVACSRGLDSFLVKVTNRLFLNSHSLFVVKGCGVVDLIRRLKWPPATERS